MTLSTEEVVVVIQVKREMKVLTPLMRYGCEDLMETLGSFDSVKNVGRNSLLNYPKLKITIAINRKRARKLRRRWFADLERVIDTETDVEWQDFRLSDYRVRTFSFSRGNEVYWGTFTIQFLPVPKGLGDKTNLEQVGMLGICQCEIIKEEEIIFEEDIIDGEG